MCTQMKHKHTRKQPSSFFRNHFVTYATMSTIQLTHLRVLCLSLPCNVDSMGLGVVEFAFPHVCFGFGVLSFLSLLLWAAFLTDQFFRFRSLTWTEQIWLSRSDPNQLNSIPFRFDSIRFQADSIQFDSNQFGIEPIQLRPTRPASSSFNTFQSTSTSTNTITHTHTHASNPHPPSSSLSALSRLDSLCNLPD